MICISKILMALGTVLGICALSMGAGMILAFLQECRDRNRSHSLRPNSDLPTPNS